MPKYKTLVDGVEVDGAAQVAGVEVELDEATAAPLVADGKLEVVAPAGENTEE